jgi:hypothetical protein
MLQDWYRRQCTLTATRYDQEQQLDDETVVRRGLLLVATVGVRLGTCFSVQQL